MLKFLKSIWDGKCPFVTTLNTTYSPFNCPLSGSTAIQGIRGVENTDDVYVSGSLEQNANSVLGLIYKGPLSNNGSLGQWHTFTFANDEVNDTYNTSCYGPCDIGYGNIRFVGSYKTLSSGNSALGMMYEGPLNGSGTYTTISPNNGNTLNVYVHSTMGDLAVGNYDTTLSTDCAFIYDINSSKCIDFKVPNSRLTTLYGIWHNGGSSYTLAGGYTKISPINGQQAFICDYDSDTHEVANFTSFSGNNEIGKSFITHFEGINASSKGYDLAAGFGNVDGGGAAYVQVIRQKDGSFTKGKWKDLKYPDQAVVFCSSDTVYKKNILGIILTKAGLASYLVNLK